MCRRNITSDARTPEGWGLYVGGMEIMRNLRKYGIKPFSAAVIHGGPGASGEMAPVAKELSIVCGILEPLQTSASLDGQLHELRTILKKHGNVPVTLIGHSWGAWLSFLLAARYPSLVKKLRLYGNSSYKHLAR